MRTYPVRPSFRKLIITFHLVPQTLLDQIIDRSEYTRFFFDGPGLRFLWLEREIMKSAGDQAVDGMTAHAARNGLDLFRWR